MDTLDLKHILEFMFPSKNVVATVYVDNSACRHIANKSGTGRLRHIQGKLLWIQHMTKSGQIKIKAVGTTWNPAVLGTKTLSADRHKMLGYMLTGWENSNISEQPKPTGTNRPLKKFATFHFPILL